MIHQAIHHGSHWINKAIIEELLQPGEPRIQPLAELSHQLLELMAEMLKVWDEVIL